jgi:hypothetical protein
MPHLDLRGSVFTAAVTAGCAHINIFECAVQKLRDHRSQQVAAGKKPLGTTNHL